MLTNSYTKPENTWAVAQNKARIRAAQSAVAADRERSMSRDREPPLAEMYAAGLEKDCREERAANRARIQRAMSMPSERVLAAMRAESRFKPKPKPVAKPVPKSTMPRRKI